MSMPPTPKNGVSPKNSSLKYARTDSRIQRTESNMSKQSLNRSKSNVGGERKAMDISTAELVNYKRLFDTFDTDGNECLSFDELKYMLLCLGIALDDDAIQELREEYDDDGNGTLDFDEFVTLMQVADLQSKKTISSEDEQKHITSLANSKRFAHNTEWRMSWDVTILLISGYHAIRSVLEVYQKNRLGGGEIAIEVIMTLVFLIDMGIYANSAYQDENGKMVDDLKLVLKKYATYSLIPDFIGAFPFDLFTIAALPDTYQDSNWYLACRIFRLFRLFRVFYTLFLPYSLTGYLTPRFVYFVYHVAPVLRAVFAFCFAVHCLAVGWLIVVDDPIRVEYLDALYLVLYTISTVGYGDIFVVGRAQRAYCSGMFIVGTLMNGIVISQMSVFLSKADIVTERKDKMRETLAVLRHFDIPIETQAEILSFQNHLLEHNLGSSHESLIAALPRSIQDNLGMFMKIKYISLVPMFASASHECKVALAQFLFNIVFQPQQFIIIAGEEGKEMYFLGHGVADVILPKGTYIATLLKGNFFGEIALLVDGAKRTASIKALTYCDIFRLEKRDFTAILNKFPMFKEQVKQQMEERVQQFQEGQEKAKAEEAKKKKEKEEAKRKKKQEEEMVKVVEVGDDRSSLHSAKSSNTLLGAGRSMNQRPVSALKRSKPGTEGSPLIEIKTDFINAVEENNKEQTGVRMGVSSTKDLTRDRDAPTALNGSNDPSREVSGTAPLIGRVEVFGENSLRDQGSDGTDSSGNYNKRGGRASGNNITVEQRDRARNVAMSFLQGPSGMIQPQARDNDVPQWQSNDGRGRSMVIPRAPTDPGQGELRQLLDRMNRMERYLSEQAEGQPLGNSNSYASMNMSPRAIQRAGSIEYGNNSVHPFDRSSFASAAGGARVGSTHNLRAQASGGGAPATNQRRVSINLRDVEHVQEVEYERPDNNPSAFGTTEQSVYIPSANNNNSNNTNQSPRNFQTGAQGSAPSNYTFGSTGQSGNNPSAAS